MKLSPLFVPSRPSFARSVLVLLSGFFVINGWIRAEWERFTYAGPGHVANPGVWGHGQGSDRGEWVSFFRVHPKNPDFMLQGSDLGRLLYTNAELDGVEFRAAEIPARHLSGVAFDPHDPDRAFVLLEAPGLSGKRGWWQTLDQGRSWTQMFNTAGPRGQLEILLVNPHPSKANELYLGTAHNGTGSGLYRSVDDGATFSQVLLAGSKILDMSINADGSALFVVTDDLNASNGFKREGTLHRVNLADLSIVSYAAAADCRFVDIHPELPDTGLLVTGNTLRAFSLSSDKATLQLAPVMLSEAGLRIARRNPANPEHLIAAAEGNFVGKFKWSNDGGETWSQWTLDGTVTPSITYYGPHNHEHSPDYFVTGTFPPNHIRGYMFWDFVPDDKDSVLLWEMVYLKGPMRSDNFGENFTLFGHGGGFKDAVQVAVGSTDDVMVLAPTEGGVVMTNDGGRSWRAYHRYNTPAFPQNEAPAQPVNPGDTNSWRFRSTWGVGVHPEDDDTVIAVLGWSPIRILKTTDFGASWTEIGQIDPNTVALNREGSLNVQWDRTNPDRVYIHDLRNDNIDAQGFTTTDGTFTLLSGNSRLSYAVTTISPTNGALVGSKMSAQEWYVSQDAGATWTRLPDPPRENGGTDPLVNPAGHVGMEFDPSAAHDPSQSGYLRVLTGGQGGVYEFNATNASGSQGDWSLIANSASVAQPHASENWMYIVRVDPRPGHHANMYSFPGYTGGDRGNLFYRQIYRSTDSGATWTSVYGTNGDRSLPDYMSAEAVIMSPNSGKPIVHDHTGLYMFNDNAASYAVYYHNASGPSSLTALATATVTADAAPSGYEFDRWVGDDAFLANNRMPSTTLTMPSRPVQLNASYRPIAAFLEQDGRLVIEAEGFSWQNPQSSSALWKVEASRSQASGNRYVLVPEINGGTGSFAGSAKLFYRIRIQNAGTYHLSIRHYSPTANADSLYVGVNGVQVGGAELNGIATSDWEWNRLSVSLGYLGAGEHTLELVRREDGLLVDKLFLANDTQLLPPNDSFANVGTPSGRTSGNTYTVTVTGGSGSGTYFDGQVVTIVADDPVGPNGSFDRWTGDVHTLKRDFLASTDLVVPQANVAVTANFIDLYALTVTDGFPETADLQQGEIIALTAAAAPSGQEFSHWSSDLGTFNSIYLNPAVFTMPAGDAAAVANYRTIQKFVEADGLVVMEAENFHASNQRNDTSYWTIDTAQAGASGGEYAISPDIAQNTISFTGGARMLYRFLISTAGTYHLALRHYNPSGNADSVFVALNGTQVGGNELNGVAPGVWRWTTISVPLGALYPGLHTLEIVRREDGILIDKIVIADAAGKLPASNDTSTGPAESQQSVLGDTYMLTVNNGTGSAVLEVGAVVGIAAAAAPSGQAFKEWTGDIAALSSVTNPNPTVTMPAADVTVTATYVNVYTLTVNNGTGGAVLEAGSVVSIAADAAPSGQAFKEWAGDIAALSSATNPSPTVTMPAADVTVTATYENIPVFEEDISYSFNDAGDLATYFNVSHSTKYTETAGAGLGGGRGLVAENIGSQGNAVLNEPFAGDNPRFKISIYFKYAAATVNNGQPIFVGVGPTATYQPNLTAGASADHHFTLGLFKGSGTEIDRAKLRLTSSEAGSVTTVTSPSFTAGDLVTGTWYRLVADVAYDGTNYDIVGTLEQADAYGNPVGSPLLSHAFDNVAVPSLSADAEVYAYFGGQGSATARGVAAVDNFHASATVSVSWFFEVENASLNGLFVPLSDANASNGSSVWVETASTRTAPDGVNFVDFTFTVGPYDQGIYGASARVAAHNGSTSNDSFYAEFLGVGSPVLWDIVETAGYHWETVPVTAYLTEGVHTLRVSLREDQTILDAVIVTNE